MFKKKKKYKIRIPFSIKKGYTIDVDLSEKGH